jgi:UDP-N-acetylmuramate: L-alanyl-gamma-D-glutamyl-meso-diaminopimelate ligase
MKHIHFIAIGGSAMHNLAIALHKKGYTISGSDDEIFEPSRTRLEKYGLLPDKIGWNPALINNSLDAVILGMHARIDNPELLRAQELGVPVYSYPEYLYEQSKDKVRVVIGGSHGKTTITAMILHVLNYQGIDADYMVGAQLEGFDVMVKLSHDAKYMILEGDEYLTSPIDRRPKFHLYKPDIAILSGIAWDHINVFPTFENYIDQFRKFIAMIPENGYLAYSSDDHVLSELCKEEYPVKEIEPYTLPEYVIKNGITSIHFDGKTYDLQVFGKHNLMNLNGARLICNKLGVSNEHFFEAISTFNGASKRLELVKKSDRTCVYKDFAHSPSKLKATIDAVKEQYPERKLVACMELHTFSSLNKEFLLQYKNAMDKADCAFVYFNPHTIEHKKLEMIDAAYVKECFGKTDLTVVTNATEMKDELYKMNWNQSNLLLMSSGNFDGLDFTEIAVNIIGKSVN